MYHLHDGNGNGNGNEGVQQHTHHTHSQQYVEMGSIINSSTTTTTATATATATSGGATAQATIAGDVLGGRSSTSTNTTSQRPQESQPQSSQSQQHPNPYDNVIVVDDVKEQERDQAEQTTTTSAYHHHQHHHHHHHDAPWWWFTTVRWWRTPPPTTNPNPNPPPTTNPTTMTTKMKKNFEHNNKFDSFRLELMDLIKDLIQYGRQKTWKKKILTMILCTSSLVVFYDLLFNKPSFIISKLHEFVVWTMIHPHLAVLAFIITFVISTRTYPIILHTMLSFFFFPFSFFFFLVRCPLTPFLPLSFISFVPFQCCCFFFLPSFFFFPQYIYLHNTNTRNTYLHLLTYSHFHPTRFVSIRCGVCIYKCFPIKVRGVNCNLNMFRRDDNRCCLMLRTITVHDERFDIFICKTLPIGPCCRPCLETKWVTSYVVVTVMSYDPIQWIESLLWHHRCKFT